MADFVERVLSELIDFELFLHSPAKGTSRRDFEKMISPECWEVGASGRRYDREAILDALEERSSASGSEDSQASGFCCQALADDLYLLTYRLLEDNRRLTRRSTIWRSTPAGWTIVFHQGTVDQDFGSL